MTRGGFRWVGLMLVVSVAATCVAMASQGRAVPEDVDWAHVKTIWDTLSAEERANYDRLAQVLLKTSPRDSWPEKTPGEGCLEAEFEISSLPFLDRRSTEGHLGALALSAFGACAGGGGQFSATGFGPDLIYKVKTDIDCELSVSMSPLTDEDLSLYVIVENFENAVIPCQFPARDCVRVNDLGGRGVTETVEFTAERSETYYIWVDGYAGDSGPYRLSITEIGTTGCKLTAPRSMP